MITIDTDKGVVSEESDKGSLTFPIGSQEAFQIISRAWLRSGWDAKYVYSFTWLGRPIIQLPEDLLRLQEVIFNVKPDYIIETGVAHGGGLIFYASLCQCMAKGKVIGIDIEIRPQNRKAIEEHILSPLITLVEGDSTHSDTIKQVESEVSHNDKVLVCLDSCHSRSHVLAELRAYSKLVSKGSYIVAMDGIMKHLVGAPRSHSDWDVNNPCAAVDDFLKENSNFVLVEPEFSFNEGNITSRVTYWPNAFLLRVS